VLADEMPPSLLFLVCAMFHVEHRGNSYVNMLSARIAFSFYDGVLVFHVEQLGDN
jgi:hypothetical protein